MRARCAEIHRQTAETDVRIRLDLDGRGRYEVSTGGAAFLIRFWDRGEAHLPSINWRAIR